MLFDPRLAATSTPLWESMAREVGCAPAANGEPEMAVGAPLLASMVKPRIWLAETSATKRNLEPESTATQEGAAPAENGEPVMAVKPPPEAMVKPDTVCSAGLATYRNFPLPDTAIETGPVAVANGDPLTAVRLPVLLSTEKAEMLFDPPFNT